MLLPWTGCPLGGSTRCTQCWASKGIHTHTHTHAYTHTHTHTHKHTHIYQYVHAYTNVKHLATINTVKTVLVTTRQKWPPENYGHAISVASNRLFKCVRSAFLKLWPPENANYRRWRSDQTLNSTREKQPHTWKWTKTPYSIVQLFLCSSSDRAIIAFTSSAQHGGGPTCTRKPCSIDLHRAHKSCWSMADIDSVHRVYSSSLNSRAKPSNLDHLRKRPLILQWS